LGRVTTTAPDRYRKKFLVFKRLVDFAVARSSCTARQALPAQSAPRLVAVVQAKEGVTDMDKITPFLWFDHQAEEAATFYTSIFKNSRILSVARYGETGPGPKGSVMTVAFQLDGKEFAALNGGPQFKFTEAVSFVVNCVTQEEVDHLWDKLSAGGQQVQCGWLKDKYGLSWQIIPVVLREMLNNPDPAKSRRVMQTMMQMKKIDIAGLKKAYGQN
jgi:predicted 3-demethylubiquinone-9 3-methyltransferase (glyoxalase superfamily)